MRPSAVLLQGYSRRSSYADARPTNALPKNARVHGKTTFVKIYATVLDG